jgi:hypothetical protein
MVRNMNMPVNSQQLNRGVSVARSGGSGAGIGSLSQVLSSLQSILQQLNTVLSTTRAVVLINFMNYVLAVIFAAGGGALLVWNKPLSERFGVFYAERFSAAFGKLASVLGWDDPRRPFNRFMYRAFVITAGLILLIFAYAALSGTNFVGPPAQPDNSLLEAR